MIFATMCVGKNSTSQYKHKLNLFSENHNLHILTDRPDLFNTATCYPYTRKVFSYYEKINFILKLSKKFKERITYIDCDWISEYDVNLKYDKISLYTYKIFSLKDENVVTDFFTEVELNLRKKLLPLIDTDGIVDYYIPEALISLPYLKNIDDIILDSKKLQIEIEKIYDKKNKNPRFYRYVKSGIGYCEGWGISAICIKYNIPTDVHPWRKTKLM